MRALAIFALAALIRIPFQASYLVNWDSVNFALGLESFDLESHQPHPPGYLGYVVLGRVIDWLIGDPVAALTTISVVAGAAATMWVYVLATRIVSERAALIAAGLFGTSPLVWYYSEVPLTYIVEVALALPLVILILDARTRQSVKLFMIATALLALMGAVRQTSLVLFLPLWIYGVTTFSRQVRVMATSVLGVLVMIWLIPLVIMSGGPINYLQLSSQLAELTGSPTWLGAGPGVIRNFPVVATALALGMHVALVAIPMEFMGKTRSRPIRREHRRLLIIWGAPALFTYLFIHSGQLGYVLVLLPIGIIWASKVFGDRITRPALVAALATALIAVNALGFFILPEIAYATVSQGEVELPERMATNSLVQRGIQQVSIPRNDAHWKSLLDWVESFDLDTTVVLAEPRDGGSFRHLSFYMPEALVYGLGNDKRGSFGHLFTSRDGKTNYSVERLEDAADRLEFPETVDKILIPDPSLQSRLDGILDLDYVEIEDDFLVAVAEPPAQGALLFVSGTPALELPGAEDSQGAPIVAAQTCPAANEETFPLDLGYLRMTPSVC